MELFDEFEGQGVRASGSRMAGPVVQSQTQQLGENTSKGQSHKEGESAKGL